MHTATNPPSAGTAATVSATVSALSTRPRTLNELVDAYMAAYTGRDRVRESRLAEWLARLGDREVATLTDDDLFHALEAIAAAPARRYCGHDADGRAIFRPAGMRSGSTLNRYHAALSGVFTWLTRPVEIDCRSIDQLTMTDSEGITQAKYV